MPGIINVSAKKDENSATIPFDFGENLEEMKTLFGEEVTFSNSRSQMKVRLQAVMRLRLSAGQSCEDLTSTYKPGVQLEKIVDPVAAIKARFSTMNEDERLAFLADLEAIE